MNRPPFDTTKKTELREKIAEPHELPRSPEWPVPRKPHIAPEAPEPLGNRVTPVSNGQKPPEVVRALASRNACKKRGTGSRALFELARDLSAAERGSGRKAEIVELMPFFDEWYRLSQPFLDRGKTRDHYFAELVAALPKVRVPTGEGDTLNKALEVIAKLSASQLPMIPNTPDAPESWRRFVALHREISRRTGSNTYFLSCRDAAKASAGMSYQEAAAINSVLERAGVIKRVRVGDQRPDGKASEFRYVLPQSDNSADEDDDEIPV